MATKSQIIRTTIVIFFFLMIISIHIVSNYTNINAFFQVAINSISCVYIGSFLAAKYSMNASKKLERKTDRTDQETMTNKDAYMFPVYGSCVLFGLYALYKYLPKELLNFVFTIHFTFLGVLCVMDMLQTPLSNILPDAWTDKQVFKIDKTFHFFKWSKQIEFDLTQVQSVALLIALFPTMVYLASKNWITNNIFGVAFSIVGIEQLNLPNFKTGFILLWGLFFYDIFWVYGTDVMVTVAKSLDVPIKLQFPYNWNESPPKFSMLGLGDIVIPGIFVALCLKYDIDKKSKEMITDKDMQSIKTPLFNWVFGGYILGIMVTYIVMVYFNHPQPALLFLVPSTTGAVLIKGLISSTFTDIWNYQEESQRKELEETKEK